MGVVGAIVAVLAYLFKDNPLMQGLLSMFGGGKQETAETPTATTPVSGAQSTPAAAQAQAQQPAVAETPKPSAEIVMAEWKQQMAANNIPQSVQLAITAKEPQLVEQLRAAQTPEQMQSIQMAAYAEATKPEWDKFVTKSKAEVSKLMDDTIREVSQSGMPSKEKQEALKGLKAEKEARIKGLETELNQIPAEQRIQIALSKDAQSKIQENIVASTTEYKKAVSENTTEISRKNNGWAWSSSVLGWASAGLAVGGIVAAPFTGGLSLGLTVAACGTGMAAGACKVINNSGKDGSNFEYGLGIAEIGLNAIPMGGLAAKSVGLFGKSAAATMTAADSLGGKAVAWVPGLSKATIAEGQAMNAVEQSAKSLTKILGEGTEFLAKDRKHALQVMKAVTSGEASLAQPIEKVGNTASKVVLERTVGVATGAIKQSTYKGDIAALVGQAIKEHKLYDPIIGKSTNAWRAASELGYTTTDSLIPTSTPQVLPADGVAKQPAPKL